MRNLDPCHRRARPKDRSFRGLPIIVPKAAYATEAEAAAIAQPLGQRVYRCSRCHNYHLTSGSSA